MTDSQAQRPSITARYNSLPARPSQQMLLELAKVAKEEALATGNLLAFLVLGTCLFDMGQIKQSEALFAQFARQIPPDPHDDLSTNLHIHYARVLGFTGRLDKAIEILDIFFDILPQIGLNTCMSFMSFYARAGRFERVKDLHDAIGETYPKYKNMIFHSSRLICYLREGDFKHFIEGVEAFASVRGNMDLSLENLDKIMELMARDLSIPKFKPALDEMEVSYLGEIRGALEAQLGGKPSSPRKPRQPKTPRQPPHQSQEPPNKPKPPPRKPKQPKQS